MRYNFTYKKGFFKTTIKDIAGHNYLQAVDKMVIYFQDGSLREISKWSSCEIFLGIDWVLATKKDMENKSGQHINLNVE